MSRPTSAHGRLARYGFGLDGGDNWARAADLLGPAGLALWDPDAHEPVDESARELLAALSRAANPDLALRQLHRVVEAERRAGPVGPPLVDALRVDEGLRRRLFAVLGASAALGDHLVAHPDQWSALITQTNGVAPDADGRLDFGANPPAGLPAVAALRRAYRLALLRIAAADLTGGRGLEQTMAAL
jgi:glutamate-ammonia-ligase adenylyltransferase